MRKRMQITPGEGLLVLLLVILSGIIFGAMVAQQMADTPYGDYARHLQFTRDMVEKGHFTSIHILYETLTFGLKTVLTVSYEGAGWLVSAFAYALTTIILYIAIRPAAAVAGTGWRQWLLSAAIAFALQIVIPITLLSVRVHNFYFGYIPVNLYHSPTSTLLKPFALLVFFFSLALLEHRIHFSLATTVIGILLVTLCLFAKPNYILSLLPALLLLIVYRIYRKNTANLKGVIITLIVPMILLLMFEYIMTYLYIDSGDSHIIFAPLLSVTIGEGSRLKLLIKFFMSILFPLVVYVVYWRETVRDFRLNFAWIVFVMGTAQMYLLAESGHRLGDGNFWWCAQITLFILFLVSSLFWLRHLRQPPRWKSWLCLGVFALHLISGLIFYVIQVQAVGIANWG